jgi:hypothetical protein
LSVGRKSVVPEPWSATVSCTVDVVPVDHMFFEVGRRSADDGASVRCGRRSIGGCRGGGGGSWWGGG